MVERRAAASDVVEAHYRRMLCLRRMTQGELERLLGGDPTAAAPWVESAAAWGLAEAQTRLGRMLLEGEGVARDPALAFAWFLRAARNGVGMASGEATNMVGRCHEMGWGTPADVARAADWYRRAAEAGDTWGQYNWAGLLFDGLGVARDRAAAVRWCRRAADRGHARAMNLLARCYEEGWGVFADRAAAREWYRRSAEGGCFRGQFNHATLLAAQGRLAEAELWFEEACRRAPARSRRSMTIGLGRYGEARLTALAERFEAEAAPQGEATR